MDNKVLLSIGVFAGVLVAVGVWVLTAGGPPAEQTDVPALLAQGAEAEPGVDPRDALMKRKMTKRPNTAMIAERVKRPTAQEVAGRPSMVLTGRAAETEVAVYSLDKEGIAAAMDERTEDLIACYETALFHTPDLEGRMVMTMQLEPRAEQGYAYVDSVETDSALDAPVFEGCIATVFEELHFDTDEATDLTWPVVFRPDGEGAE